MAVLHSTLSSQGSVATLFRRAGKLLTIVSQIYSGQCLPNFIRIDLFFSRRYDKNILVCFFGSQCNCWTWTYMAVLDSVWPPRLTTFCLFMLQTHWFLSKNRSRLIGPDKPAFSFTRNRQCGLLDQYSQLPWPIVTGCSLQKSLFLLSLPDFQAVNNGVVFSFRSP